MNPCWRDYGLSEKGALLADDILAELVAIVERAGGPVAHYALQEARFRVERLPMRTKKFRKAYLKENGGEGKTSSLGECVPARHPGPSRASEGPEGRESANHHALDGKPLAQIRAALKAVMRGALRLNTVEWYAENSLAFDAIEELMRKSGEGGK